LLNYGVLAEAAGPSAYDRFTPVQHGASLVLAFSLSAIAACVAVLALSKLSVEESSVGVLEATWVLLTLCILPAVIWVVRKARTAPVFELICLSYAIHFGLTGLLLPNEYVSVRQDVVFSDAELQQSVLAVAFGVALMVASYYALLGSRLVQRIPALDIRINRRLRDIYLPLAVLVGLGVTAAQTSGLAPTAETGAATFHVAATQLLIAIALLTYLVAGKRKPRRGEVLLLGIGTSLAVFLGIATSMVESILLVPLTIGTISLQLRKPVVIGLLAAVAIAYLFVLQPVKAEYRAQIGRLQEPVGIAERLGLWLDTTVG
jgi:hypothetical protein